MFSPGLTTNTSSFKPSDALIFISLPSRITFAVFGTSFIKLFNASVVLPLEWDSSIFPTVINVKIIAADSKYNSIIYFITNASSPLTCADVIKNNDTVL